MDRTSSDLDPMELATDLTVAWLSNGNTRTTVEETSAFLATMHRAVTELGEKTPQTGSSTTGSFIPAVSARRSLASKDHIVSMIDGKPYRTLKLHLSKHGLTPRQYRERYGLRPDYPMVAEGYAQVRRDLAIALGLGGRTKKARSGGTSAARSRPKTAGRATGDDGSRSS